MDLDSIIDGIVGPFNLQQSNNRDSLSFSDTSYSWITGPLYDDCAIEQISEARNITIEDFERLERRVDALEKMIKNVWLHSAALGGHRCGHQRPPCGATATRN